MQTANGRPQGPNPEHMHCPELFSLPHAPAGDDRGASPQQGTYALRRPEQMPARTHISSSLGRLLRYWIQAQKARTGPS